MRTLVVASLVILAACASCRRKSPPSPPGESGDAAAAGSGYGVGRADKTAILGDDRPVQGRSPHDPGDRARQQDAGADARPPAR